MDINGIKLVNFELRNYDPYLGRWMSADPYHQFYSPYLAMFNNPVRFVDPDGGWATSDGTDDYDDSGDNKPDNSILMMVLDVFSTMSELGYFDESASDGFTYNHWWLVTGGEMNFDTWVYTRFDAMTPAEYYSIFGDHAPVMLNEMKVYEDGKSTWRETWAEVQVYLNGITSLDKVNEAVGYGMTEVVQNAASMTISEYTIENKDKIKGGTLLSSSEILWQQIDQATMINPNIVSAVPTIVPGKGGGMKTGGTGLIRNAGLAGKVHPKTGVQFNDKGFPNFSKFLYKGGVNDVMIKPTGNRAADFAAANRAAGYNSTPKGYTWHHHETVGRMQLVETGIHSQTGHTGGFSLW